jgi:hypothetical protein
VEAWRWLEPRQVPKLPFGHRRKLDKTASAMSEPKELALLPSAVNEQHNLKDELKQEHRQAQENEEEEDACLASARGRQGESV